jgi:hypothetical protein
MLMRARLLVLLFYLPPALFAREIPLTATAVVRFASEQEGAALLASRDAYVALMSPFDRAVRMHSAVPVSPETFLRYLAQQCLSWTDAEMEKYGRFLATLRPKLQAYDLSFPAEVLLVKTTSADEGGAAVAYTRQNAIIVTRKMLQQSDGTLQKILVHELFHILSRHDPDLQIRLYELIGFQRCNEIILPESLAKRKLTNPDAPGNNNRIRLTHQDTVVQAIPLIYARDAVYDADKGSTVFDFLEFRLLAVTKRKDLWQASLRSGEAVLYDVSEVDGFFEQIGRNTGYIIHPEEILADNFVHLVNGTEDLPSPGIVAAMKAILQRRYERLQVR